MPRSSRALPTLTAACALAIAACGQPAAPSATPEASAASEAPGAADPMEVIEARRVLMAEAERQIKPIDLYTLGTPADPAALRSAAVTIETLLLALPHLFPPTTNLFDPSTREPPTTALPAVWENFGAFEQMAANAEMAAAALTAADGEDAFKEAARTLRAACDACHAAFVKTYVPPQATDADRDFDFDEFLPK